MKNKAILEFESNKLTDFDSWYTSDVVTYLTYLNINKQTELLRYTFLEILKNSFKASTCLKTV